MPLSFKLHRDLALEHGGEERWGYRRVSCGNLEARGRKRSELEGLGPAPGLGSGMSLGKMAEAKKTAKAWTGTGLPKDLDWILPELVTGYEKMGGSRETAQVHPYHFTMALMRMAEERGAELVIGSVKDINYADASSPASTPPLLERSGNSPSSLSVSSTSSKGRRKVESITYLDGSTKRLVTITATHAVLAAGPWTAKLFPSAPITGLRAHSVTITPAYPVSGYALFTELTPEKIHRASASSTQTLRLP